MNMKLRLRFSDESGIECSKCMICGTKGLDLNGETVMACYGLGIRPKCPEEKGRRKDCPLVSDNVAIKNEKQLINYIQESIQNIIFKIGYGDVNIKEATDNLIEISNKIHEYENS